jgi:hypothetical protein
MRWPEIINIVTRRGVLTARVRAYSSHFVVLGSSEENGERPTIGFWLCGYRYSKAGQLALCPTSDAEHGGLAQTRGALKRKETAYRLRFPSGKETNREKTRQPGCGI